MKLHSKGFVPARIATRVNALLDVAALGWAAVLAQRSAHVHVTTAHLVATVSVAVAVWMTTAVALRHYDTLAYQRERSDDGSLVAVLNMASITILFLGSLVAPGTLTVPAGPYFLFGLISTAAVRFGLRTIARHEVPVDEILVVGIGPIGRITGQDVTHRGSHRVHGYLRYNDESERDFALLARATPEGKLLGTASELENVLRVAPVSEVYLAGNVRKHDDEMQACIKVCERLGIPFALPAAGFRLERAQPRSSHEITDGYLHYLQVDSKPSQRKLKRLFDIAASACALWALLPLLLVVAAIIKLTSRGSVLFKQTRTGLYGRTFHMLKFRSMVVNAEELKARLAALNEQQGPVFKMKNDPRITWIGRFIRKFSIDELPQLINVLRGDMSIVGPRPPVPAEVARYEAWQLRRLSVRPGLTCIWQVSGRNQISFEQWMYLDLQYIDNWSLRQDFSLVFRTVPAVLTGRGAS
jgi:exopolysaccharide biosynthesis polyprenyl glycosylphosphotransferase